MTRIDDLLDRALLVRNRTVPRDTIPSTPTPPTYPFGNDTQSDRVPHTDTTGTAAEDLQALCETLIARSPTTAVNDFVTEQVPEPRSALILACLLQLSDTDAGARFWWQYAAGAGQPTAAYCLYLHHLALGEHDTAAWWHDQAADVLPPDDSGHDRPPGTVTYRGPVDVDPAAAQAWYAGTHKLANSSTSTMLRVLRALARTSTRPRSTAVHDLMDYVATAVAVGYLWRPDLDLPTPGSGFARQIAQRLAKHSTYAPTTTTAGSGMKYHGAPEGRTTQTPGRLPQRAPTRPQTASSL